MPARDVLFHRRFWAQLELWLGLFVYLASLGVAQWMASRTGVRGVNFVYIFILAIVIFHAYLEHGLSRRLLLSLSLVPLIRLLELAIPPASFYQLYRWVLVMVPVFVAAVVLMARLKLGVREVGLTAPRKIPRNFAGTPDLKIEFTGSPKIRRIFGVWMSGLPWQAGVALSGFPLGLAEWLAFRPERLVVGLGWEDLILPGLGFLLCGFVVELIFRGIMQQTFGNALGWPGLVYVSLIFGLVNMSRPSGLGFLLGFGAGLFFAWVVRRTGSLFGVAFAHGIAAWELYLLLPGLA